MRTTARRWSVVAIALAVVLGERVQYERTTRGLRVAARADQSAGAEAW